MPHSGMLPYAVKNPPDRLLGRIHDSNRFRNFFAQDSQCHQFCQHPLVPRARTGTQFKNGRLLRIPEFLIEVDCGNQLEESSGSSSSSEDEGVRRKQASQTDTIVRLERYLAPKRAAVDDFADVWVCLLAAISVSRHADLAGCTLRTGLHANAAKPSGCNADLSDRQQSSDRLHLFVQLGGRIFGRTETGHSHVKFTLNWTSRLAKLVSPFPNIPSHPTCFSKLEALLFTASRHILSMSKSTFPPEATDSF